MESRTEKSHHLFEVAESQQGYFTSADAKRLGYDYPHQHFHVNQGNWIRVDRGIYRLKKFPAAKYEDLMRWWLWSRKKGSSHMKPQPPFTIWETYCHPRFI